ncbi:MAG: poly(ADP-ribose) glycohydrolase [archaeon]|nr:poly(ADP-ribose) glycohydrolase [archaeon]
MENTEEVHKIDLFNDYDKHVHPFNEYFNKEIKTLEDADKLFYKRMSFFSSFKKEDSLKEFSIKMLEALPQLIKLCLQCKELFPTPLILLQTGTKMKTELVNGKPQIVEGKIELTRKQVACLMALSFFGYLDVNQPRNYNTFEVSRVLSSFYRISEFGLCFTNYLMIIGLILKEEEKYKDFLNEKLIYARKNLDRDLEIYKVKEMPLCDINIIEQGSMSDSDGLFHVDFANKYIGGGVLGGGCVQEEILFTVKPECTLSLLLLQVMDDNDAILIQNALQYSNYTGYGYTFAFKYESPEGIIDNLTNIEGRFKGGKYIIAMDAVPDYNGSSFEKENAIRDIHKALVTFSFVELEHDPGEDVPMKVEGEKPKKTVVTGNWGCGAFSCDYEHKFLEQWVAASFAGVDLLEYYTFNNPGMKNPIKWWKKIKEKIPSAMDLYQWLINEDDLDFDKVFQCLFKRLAKNK